MNTWTSALETVLPVVLTLTIGMLARRTRLLDRRGIDALKSVVVNITLPAVMLNACATMEYSLKNVIVVAMMFLICVLAWLLGRLPSRLRKGDPGFVPFLTTGFEAGMLGYSLYMLLYGSDRISEFACIDLGQVLFVFTLYKILLKAKDAQRATAGDLARDMLRSPTILAIAAGVLIGATGLYRAMIPSGMAGLLDACTDFVSAPTAAIILLTIGYDLVFGEILWRQVAQVVGLRIVIMVVLRLLAGVVVRAIGLGNTLDDAMNMMFILPAPFVLPVFAEDDSRRAYISSSLSVMMLVTIAVFIVLAVR